MASEYDVVVIGGGIVGLATAHELLNRHAGLRLAVLEKEDRVAAHQSGRNSGVIHSGIYYKPGSSKAINCRRGRELLLRYCDEADVPYRLCGKVIVATSETECAALDRLERFGAENGVRMRLVNRSGLKELEPHAEGIRALHVLDAGVVDFADVCKSLVERLKRLSDAPLHLGVEVRGFFQRGAEIVVETTGGALHTRAYVNAAGLHCDEVARLAGAKPPVTIVPFRGEYYRLREEAATLVKTLIYPVPDPQFPFLGIHLTRHLDESVSCGPGATLALARESYERFQWSGTHLRELIETRAFWNMMRRYRALGMKEYLLALSRRRFAESAQRLVPEVNEHDFLSGHAGIRAQAVDPDGRLLDDFAFGSSTGAVHVYNAPSPAATSSFNIARYVADRVDACL